MCRLVLWCLAVASASAAPTFSSFSFFSPPAPPAPPKAPAYSSFTFFQPRPAPPTKVVAAPTPPPAQDCVYAQWTQWSHCTAQCDQTAFISRTRSVLKEASGYGQKCEPGQLEQWQECRGEACARDCVMAEWTAWSACSAQCGQGQRGRWRQVASQPINGGAPCGQTEESEPCQDKPCAVDCQMSQWAQWTQCSAQCGPGSRSRVRSILVQDQNGGQMCGPAEDWEACFDQPCAVDCEMSQWSAWSACSVECGQGSRARLRSVLVQAQNGGQMCGPVEDWEACFNGPCPRDCVVGEWAPWSPCPACGQASRSRNRGLVEQGAFGGQVCDAQDLSEQEQCQLSPCPVDCVMEQWSTWSDCSADCNGGSRARVRGVVTPAQNGGLLCGPAEEWEKCNSQPCAVDCVMAQWSAWSDCSADCAGGSRARVRSILTLAENGGLLCGPAEEWEACNNQPCPQDCAYGNWAAWSACPACGPAALRSRSRPVTQQGAFGGQQCDFASLSESEQCNIAPCPVDCEMTQWSGWSDCSVECGEGGQRQRLRSVLVPAQNNGLACGPQEEWEACFVGPCAVDCAVSQWGAWSACSADCGQGSRQRLRQILSPAANGGQACPALEDWAQCSNGPCKAPSVCDGVIGQRFLASGCSRDFVLCSAGQEFPKECPEPSFFDVESSTCRLAKDVPACAALAPPQPKPQPDFSRLAYDASNEATNPIESMTPEQAMAELMKNNP